jgi:hypothetical protein
VFGNQTGPSDAGSQQFNFTAFNLPSITPSGSASNSGLWRSTPYRVEWFGWVGGAVGEGAAQTRNITSLEGIISSTPDFPLDIIANFTCTLPGGDPGVPVSNRRLHNVEEGETMEGLSQRYYGTPSRADDIRNANPNLLGLEDWGLWPGQILEIPN